MEELRIDPRIAYDVVELPSRGILYENGKKSLRVAYLTAADENILASPNLIQTNAIVNELLKRKILDRDLTVDELVETPKIEEKTIETAELIEDVITDESTDPIIEDVIIEEENIEPEIVVNEEIIVEEENIEPEIAVNEQFIIGVEIVNDNEEVIEKKN